MCATCHGTRPEPRQVALQQLAGAARDLAIEVGDPWPGFLSRDNCCG
jgi:hypothetical protein